MFRRVCPLLFCAVLASTPVRGADFIFAARVSVLPSLSVSAAPTGDTAAVTETLAMTGMQDQCLDVGLVATGAATAQRATRPDGPQGTDLIRLVVRDGSPLASHMLGAPASTTVQINLN